MSAVTDAPVMPPTDRLLTLLEPDPTLLARVLLAMLRGAAWHRRGEDRTDLPMSRWVLEFGDLGGNVGLLHWWDGSGETDDWLLPNPFNDPAAAWDLLVSYKITLVAPEGDDPTWCGWASGKGANAHADPRRACAVAVLRAHATGPLSFLIVPTLERLENVR